MSFNGERILGGVLPITVMAALGSVSSASHAELPDPHIGHAETVETVCVNVSDFEPFDDASCERLARNAEAGIRHFSELTDNAIDPPHRFTHRILSRVVEIDDAVTRRCTNLAAASPTEYADTLEIMDDATNAVLDSENLDSTDGLIIGVNSPVATCGVTPGKLQDWLAPPTDRCIPPPPNQVGYMAARALSDILNNPAVFTYTGEPTELGDTVKQRDIIHEWGHVVTGSDHTRQLGHEFGLCSLAHDQLPATIGPEQAADLQANIRVWDGSLMSYSRNYEGGTYLAAPQLAYLNVIRSDQIVIPRKSGSFVLGDFTDRTAPALLRLDLTSQAVRDIIRPTLPSSISPADYDLWLGKIPTPKNAPTGTPPTVGIYAAPVPEKSSQAPIYLLSIARPGDRWDLQNGAQFDFAAGSNNTVEVTVQLPQHAK